MQQLVRGAQEGHRAGVAGGLQDPVTGQVHPHWLTGALQRTSSQEGLDFCNISQRLGEFLAGEGQCSQAGQGIGLPPLPRRQSAQQRQGVLVGIGRACPILQCRQGMAQADQRRALVEAVILFLGQLQRAAAVSLGDRVITLELRYIGQCLQTEPFKIAQIRLALLAALA